MKEIAVTIPQISSGVSGRMSYNDMVLEAVTKLNEKHGSSLNAIRKYILANLNVRQQQTASFNNLTLKAANRLVADTVLEKQKHSFCISAAEKARRKEAEKQAILQAKRQTYQFVEKPQVKHLNLSQIQ